MTPEVICSEKVRQASINECCTSRICWWTAGSAAASRLRGASEFERAVQIRWAMPFGLRKSEIRDCRRRPWRLDQPSRAGCGLICASIHFRGPSGRSSPLDCRSVSCICLDRVDIGTSRKGLGRRLARLARTADGGKEFVQAGRQIGPSHLELIGAVIDTLASRVGQRQSRAL